MPRFIVRLTDSGKDYYLEWSTVVDAPVSYGMPRREFQQYYRERYGFSGYPLAKRLERADTDSRCSSLVGHTLDELISSNSAGDHEACLTLEEIIQRYVRERPPGATTA